MKPSNYPPGFDERELDIEDQFMKEQESLAEDFS